jgi:anti-sigma factor RsiW
MINHEHNHEFENELDWQAFCYLSGELNEAETEQFEARLADDQAAREALARAVELTQAVAAAESQAGAVVIPAGRGAADWSTRVSWMAVGGLAAVLLAILWSGAVGPAWQGRNAAGRIELASAWMAAREEIKLAGFGGPALGDDAADDAAFSTDLRSDNLAIDEAPSWMTAAVLSVNAEAPEAADGDLFSDGLE